MTKSVRGGQRISGNLSAAEWNFVRAQAYRSAMSDFSMGGAAGEAGSLDGIVQVVNRTSGALNVGDVVGLDAPTIQASDFGEFRASMLFAAAIPTESHMGRCGIMLDGCAAGDVGPACIWGPTWARVTMQSATDRFCEVTPDSKTALTSASTGSVAILYAHPAGDSYPQEAFAYVRLGNTAAQSHIALFATATLTEALTTGTAAIGSFSVASPAPFDREPETEPTSAANPRMHRGKSGDTVFLVRVNDTEWQVIDVAKHAVKIAVGIGSDGPLRVQDNKIQGYMATLAVELDDTPAWEDLITGTGCPAP